MVETICLMVETLSVQTTKKISNTQTMLLLTAMPLVQDQDISPEK